MIRSKAHASGPGVRLSEYDRRQSDTLCSAPTRRSEGRYTLNRRVHSKRDDAHSDYRDRLTRRLTRIGPGFDRIVALG